MFARSRGWLAEIEGMYLRTWLKGLTHVDVINVDIDVVDVDVEVLGVLVQRLLCVGAGHQDWSHCQAGSALFSPASLSHLQTPGGHTHTHTHEHTQTDTR